MTTSSEAALAVTAFRRDGYFHARALLDRREIEDGVGGTCRRLHRPFRISRAPRDLKTHPVRVMTPTTLQYLIFCAKNLAPPDPEQQNCLKCDPKFTED